MATVIVGDSKKALRTNDQLREGIEVVRVEQLRSKRSLQLRSNTRTVTLVSGSSVTTNRLAEFNDTLVEPRNVSIGGNLALQTQRTITLISHDFERRDLGYDLDSNGANPNVPFIEKGDFDPVVFIASGDERYPLPPNVVNQDFENPYRLNGTLEPLTIRPVVSLASIESPFESHGVWGGIGSMHAETLLRKFNPIARLVPYIGEENSNEPFLDAPPVFISATEPVMPEIGIVESTGAPLSAFVEGNDVEANASRYRDAEISALFVANVTGSLEVYPPLDAYVATGGWQVTETQLRRRRNVGTDSIAFVGLER